MKIPLPLSILSCLLLGACAVGECPLETKGASISELEEMVSENCRIVQEAVEAYAAENNVYYYPADVYYDYSLAGHSLIELLPGGSYLRNPFSNCLCEPRDGRATRWGETGYEALSPAGWCVGYKITGAGRDGSVLVRITNIGSSNEAMVTGNCLELQNALKIFILSTGGIFPRNLRLDTTPSGDTVMDLLWGPHPYLENPYTRNYDQLVERRAHYSGETGCEVLEEGGVRDGARGSQE
jgi:hypothetical protein